MYCTQCGKECVGIIVDLGIGLNEFWGRPGVNRDKRALSSCCKSPMQHDDGTPVTVKDVKKMQLYEMEEVRYEEEKLAQSTEVSL